MGQIVSSYDILPESTDIDLNTVIETIPKVLPEGVKLGLMKVNAGFAIDDSIETIGTDLENALTSIPGIQNVECVSSTNY